MKKIYDCVVATGKYTGQDGQEKTRWMNVGAILQKDDGSAVLKLEAMPIGNDFEGWIQLFKPKPSQNAPQAAPQQSQGFVDDPIPDSLGVPFQHATNIRTSDIRHGVYDV